MAIKAIIATQFDATGIKKASKEFGRLGSTLRSTLGAIGLGVGLAALTAALKDSAKAAVEDAKSQALLAQQLKNTLGVTDDQVASVEKSISAMQMSAAVADDVLRPAFAQLVRATGDLGVATKLTQLALDVSAGTGRDLGAVSIALSRAYGGNTAALSRLGIKAKEGVNIFDQLATQFNGAAAAAANNDPFQRMSIILGEMQEQLGAILLPLLNDFAAFLASSDFGKSFSNLVVAIKSAAGALDIFFAGISGKGAFQTLIDLAAAAAVGVSQIAFALADVGTTAGFILSGQFDKAGQQMGSFFARYNRFVQGIYAEQDKAAVGAGKYVSPFNFDNIVVGTNTQSKIKTKAAEKAKQVANAAAQALAKATAALNEFKEGLTDLSSGFEPLTQASSDLGEFQRSVVDTFDSINKKIAEGVANKTIASKGLDNLRNFLKAQQNLLEENARQRDAIIEKRSLAKALFDDVKSSLMGTGSLASLLETQTRQVTKSVTKIVDGFTVTTRQTVDEIIGGQGVVSKLKEVVAKTKAFATQLTSLKALGLNPDLFKQIVDAGPEVGGQLAKEILDGGADSVKALNDTFTELQTVTTAVAEQTAVVMFNAGVEVAGGLVAGLLSEETRLINAAKQLAESFNAEFKKSIDALQTPAMADTRTQTFKLGDLAKIDLKTVTGDDAWKASAALAKKLIASPQYTKGSQIMITVNAGVGTNGKTVGQAIQAELNKYAKSSSK